MQLQNTTNGGPAIHEEFLLGEWKIQPQLNRIVTLEGTIQIEPKIMGVLLCLARKQGSVVSREELMQQVWPDTYIAEITLTRCVSELRKIFGDDSQDPRAIETIRKKGYRLLLPVSPSAPASNSDFPETPSGLTFSPNSGSKPLEKSKKPLIGFAFVAVVAVIMIAGAVWLWSSPASSYLSSMPLKVIPLTSLPGREIDPALSPDGKQVAFAWGGEADDNFDIYVKPIDAEKPLRLTDNPARDCRPVWSPDGKRLAFLRYRQRGCEIFVVSALGGDERVVASCQSSKPPDLTWSPDGETLAYSDRNSPEGPARIVTLSLLTGEKRTLTSSHPNNRYGDRDPVFSPDGSAIAFERILAEEAQEIFLIPANGGEEKQLTFDQRRLSGHDWTHDGQRIIFASDRGGSYSFWSIAATGGNPEWLPTGQEGIINPSIASREPRLAFQRISADANIWRVPLNGPSDAPATSERFIASTRIEAHPQFSPDGKHIAFTSDRTGSLEIWTMKSYGSDFAQQTFFGGAFVGLPRWSPDGRSLCFVARPNGDPDIYTLATSGGAVRKLTSDPADDWSPSWSQDGRWIYFGSTRSGSWQIWRIPADGGQAQQVTRNGGIMAYESEDGEYLYYSKSALSGIWRMRIETGEESLIVDQSNDLDWNNWLLTDKGIFFVRRDSIGPAIIFYSFATGQKREVYRPEKPPIWSMPGLALSPDGSSLLFTQLDRYESDLMLVEEIRMAIKK